MSGAAAADRHGARRSFRFASGQAGVPKGLETHYVGPSSITYRWTRPNCDESYGPIEGFEYLVGVTNWILRWLSSNVGVIV